MVQHFFRKWGIFLIPVLILAFTFAALSRPALAQQDATATPTPTIFIISDDETPTATPFLIDTPTPLPNQTIPVLPTPTQIDPTPTPTRTLPPLATATPVIPETGANQLQGVRILTEENIRSVTVNGSGRASARPDTAVVVVGVYTQADEAQAALNQNNQQMNALIEALVDAGVAREDIQTQFVRLNPLREEPREPGTGQRPQIVGYEATNTVQVRITDIERVGEIIDTAIESGGNLIENIRFEIADREDLVEQAREAAVQDAREKAQQLARLTGSQLGVVITINETTRGFPRPAVVEEAADAAIPIEPGAEDIEISLQITWELTSGQ